MAYQVYRREAGSESVKPISKDVFKTREEAEMALNEAQNNLRAEPNILDLDGLFDQESTESTEREFDSDKRKVHEENVEFFIRKV